MILHTDGFSCLSNYLTKILRSQNLHKHVGHCFKNSTVTLFFLLLPDHLHYLKIISKSVFVAHLTSCANITLVVMNSLKVEYNSQKLGMIWVHALIPTLS